MDIYDLLLNRITIDTCIIPLDNLLSDNKLVEKYTTDVIEKVYDDRTIDKGASLSYLTLIEEHNPSILDDWVKSYNSYENKLNIETMFAMRHSHILIYIGDNNKHSWAVFSKGRWHIGVSTDRLIRLLDNFLQKCSDIISQIEHETILKTYNRFFSIVSSMLFFDDWVDLTDRDDFIVCTDNCIIDLRSQITRKGLPGDFCTKSVGYSLPDKLNPDDEKFLMDFFSEVFEEDIDKTESFLMSTAAVLEAGNRHKKVICLAGEKGYNAKTTIMNFLIEVFGGYAFVAPDSLLTSSKMSSGDATPILKSLRGIRLCSIPEVGDKDKLLSNVIKLLTGRDVSYYRGLYEGGSNSSIKATLFLTFNRAINLQQEDLALTLRFLVYSGDVQFLTPELIDRIPINMRNGIRSADTDMQNKLSKKKGAMLKLLITYYKKFKKSGYLITENIKNDTKRLIECTDEIRDFVESTLETDSNNTDGIQCKRLYRDFKIWHSEERPSKKMLDYKIFKERLSLIGLVINENLYGYKIKLSNIDIWDI
eukprot:TRINITY_DN6151_c0_g4_i1.p1 TRINITY_DN6151_c0_g4~~TRINITY_DN6151_c0_g4_i1.p1  ORF type:complete len:534 (+),score=74.25 TRINITY_DN6151_c0_g4_i1:25-1626(+)